MILTVDDGHRYEVAAVDPAAGTESGERLRAGDQLETIDRVITSALSFPAVLARLRGARGEYRTLTIRRDGETRTIVATVAHVI